MPESLSLKMAVAAAGPFEGSRIPRQVWAVAKNFLFIFKVS